MRSIGTFRPRAQRGVMLIEALIAILIFSIGVLGVIGLQGSAVKVSTDARYRSEAALLANEIIGQMWSGNRNQATLQAAYSSGNSAAFLGNNTNICRANVNANGAGYENWAWRGNNPGAPGTMAAPAEGTVLRTLPGATAFPPTVAITSDTGTSMPSSRVTIVVCWQAPGDTAVHNYTAVAQIGG